MKGTSYISLYVCICFVVTSCASTSNQPVWTVDRSRPSFEDLMNADFPPPPKPPDPFEGYLGKPVRTELHPLVWTSSVSKAEKLRIAHVLAGADLPPPGLQVVAVAEAWSPYRFCGDMLNENGLVEMITPDERARLIVTVGRLTGDNRWFVIRGRAFCREVERPIDEDVISRFAEVCAEN